MTTFGELLHRARDDLARCDALPVAGLSERAAADAADAAGRVALTLSRFLGDMAPHGVVEVVNGRVDPLTRVAVDAREALSEAAASLRSSGAGAGRAAAPLVAGLDSAGSALAAGRDLLNTHFAVGPDRQLVARSDWSAVVRSAPVAASVLEEVARWTQQLGLLTARLSVTAAADRKIPVAVSQRMAEGCRGLIAASAILAAGRSDEEAVRLGAELLHAVPAHVLPDRLLPGNAEAVAELVAGVAASAARLRFGTFAAGGLASWSPARTADSWRWTATGAAVICNISQVAIGTIVRQPELAAAAAGHLPAAAEAAANACVHWRTAAAAWTDMTTSTAGLTAPGVGDISDLVVRLGRLAFANPGWTPARSRSAPPRSVAALAPDARQAAAVVGAIHHAAEALACTASADLNAIRLAVRTNRVYVPTRTLPDRLDVPHRFWQPTPAQAAGLIGVYQAAAGAAGQLVRELDGLAVTVHAPSRIRAMARAAVKMPRMRDEQGTNTEAVGLNGSRAQTADTSVADRPGLVERAVREVGCTEIVVLMRARAIDAAAHKLIAEVGAAAPGRSDPASARDLLETRAQSAARLAAKSFPSEASQARVAGASMRRGPTPQAAVAARQPTFRP